MEGLGFPNFLFASVYRPPCHLFFAIVGLSVSYLTLLRTWHDFVDVS